MSMSSSGSWSSPSPRSANLPSGVRRHSGLRAFKPSGSGNLTATRPFSYRPVTNPTMSFRWAAFRKPLGFTEEPSGKRSGSDLDRSAIESPLRNFTNVVRFGRQGPSLSWWQMKASSRAQPPRVNAIPSVRAAITGGASPRQPPYCQSSSARPNRGSVMRRTQRCMSERTPTVVPSLRPVEFPQLAQLDKV